MIAAAADVLNHQASKRDSMITLSLAGPIAADVGSLGTEHWVTLRIGGFNRLVLHTNTPEHADAIARAVNGERPQPIPSGDDAA